MRRSSFAREFLGDSPVAIVLPTFTWQAYNFHDDDGDGRGDTWYNWRTRVARLGRPYENRAPRRITSPTTSHSSAG